MKKTATSPLEKLLLEYRKYLIEIAGHRPATGKAWVFYARIFLRHQFKRRARRLNWEAVQPQTVLRFFAQQARVYGPFRLQLMATALRSFCRFLRLQNYCQHDWSAGIPPIAAKDRSSSRSYLSSEQLAQLLAGAHTRGLNGRRDLAIIVCLAKLGLRAGEVASLSLEDLQWSEGVLSLPRSKGRKARQFPLPELVGKTIADYLRHERPASVHRNVFLARSGKPLSANTISGVVTKHLKRVGLPKGGAHLLRRTVASHLVQSQASLKEVADLLGHQSLATTMVYTQVNLPMLRQVIMPWPAEVVQ